MTSMDAFVPGLVLCRRFFEEAAAPIIDRVVHKSDWAAGLTGRGSDVLGFDTAISMDHDWGPRFQVFLPDDAPAAKAERIDAELRQSLPRTFLGFPVDYEDPDLPEPSPDGHHIVITTTGSWLRRFLGCDPRDGVDTLTWLTFPEQRLVELTAGAVFRDPRGELTAMREALAYHPREVWLYRMACQWQRLCQVEGFIGRSAEAGDELGMRVLAARIVRDIMRLCFLLERRYAPYEKWLGTAFGRLACAPRMSPYIREALEADDYAGIEAGLVGAYGLLAGMHNELGVTGAIDGRPRRYHARDYQVIRAEQVRQCPPERCHRRESPPPARAHGSNRPVHRLHRPHRERGDVPQDARTLYVSAGGSTHGERCPKGSRSQTAGLQAGSHHVADLRRGKAHLARQPCFSSSRSLPSLISPRLMPPWAGRSGRAASPRRGSRPRG